MIEATEYLTQARGHHGPPRNPWRQGPSCRLFVSLGQGHLTKQSEFRGAVASARARAHTLQSYPIILFSSPAARCAPVLG